MTTYISANDTCKAIRATLKAAFPTIKFSVRQTAGGSVRIEWTDGVTGAQVKALTDRYAGATFDGMNDLKSYRYETNADGEEIHYRVDYIFTERNLSAAFLRPIAERVAKMWRQPVPEITEDKWGAHIHSDPAVRIGGYYNLRDLILREAAQISA